MSMHPVVTWLLDQPHNFVFPDFRMADRQDPGLPYMWDSGMDGGPPGGTSSDVPQMDASSGIPTSFPYGSNRLKSPHLNRPMSVPPPSAHMYNPQVPRSLDNPIPAHGGPMGISTSAPTASSTSSPLVVPHPVKMTRTNKTYHCRMCDQEFPTKSGMQRHARDIHMLQEKSHKCEKCFKSFPSSQQLTQHMLVHNNMRKYKCNYCEKSFKQLSHVQQHHRRHTGERPYKCMIEDCGKAFAQLSNLQQHQRNHENRKAQTERKPYLCTICDRRFATEASLNNHVSKVHKPDSPPPLNMCDAAIEDAILHAQRRPPEGIDSHHVTQPTANERTDSPLKVKDVAIMKEHNSHAEILVSTPAGTADMLCGQAAPIQPDIRDLAAKLSEISKRDLNLLRFSRASLYDFPSQVPHLHQSMYGSPQMP